MPYMNGDASPANLSQSAVEITDQLLNGQKIEIPTLRQLRHSSLTDVHLANALEDTSKWTIEKLSDVTAQVALEINGKRTAM